MLGIAQTGTGKTGAFVLPMLTHLSKGRARARMPRSLVLAPTRELAAQVAEQFEKYSAHLKLSMALLIGGVSFKDQDKLIDRGVDVLIATPGRLLDHFERGKLMLTGVQIMVVDEADRMLDMGFIPDIERIFKLVPFTRQTLFFSATMAPEITRITEDLPAQPGPRRGRPPGDHLGDHRPVRRRTTPRAARTPPPPRSARCCAGSSAPRATALTNGIIFCNRKVDVDILAKSLKRHGFDAAGDARRPRPEAPDEDPAGVPRRRAEAPDRLRRRRPRPRYPERQSHIFNFDVPIHSEDYVHRIGRTGRAGRSGKSITLCLPLRGEVPRQDRGAGEEGDPGRWRARSSSDDASRPAPRASPPRRRPRPERGRRGDRRPSAAPPSRQRRSDSGAGRSRRRRHRRARAAARRGPPRAAAGPRPRAAAASAVAGHGRPRPGLPDARAAHRDRGRRPEEPETPAVETPASRPGRRARPASLPRPRRRTRSRAATAAEAPATDAA